MKCRVKLPNCSYGHKGDLIDINVKELTDRQKVMIEPVTEGKQVVKKVEVKAKTAKATAETKAEA